MSHPSQTVDYFNQTAPAWSDKYLGRGHFKTRLETVLAWIQQQALPKNSRILDFGCGSGVFINALVGQGFTVTGVDASAGMIEASELFLSQNQPNAKSQYQLEVIDSQSFQGQYQANTYTGVCCLGVLEYVENDTALLKTLSQNVDPNGFVILSVPNQNSLLRHIEQFVFQNPGFFKALGLFSHLTGPDSYLNFQKHQYKIAHLDARMAQMGFTRHQLRYHVAPGPLRVLEGLFWVGMSAIALYRRS